MPVLPGFAGEPTWPPRRLNIRPRWHTLQIKEAESQPSKRPIWPTVRNPTILRTNTYNPTRPKLYFVKVDVQGCFDTIEQTKLLQILRQLISEVLSILSFFVVLAYLLLGHLHDTEIWAGEYGAWTNQEKLCQESRPWRLGFTFLLGRLSNISLFADDHPHFLRHATDLANVLRNTIFVDQVPALAPTHILFANLPQVVYPSSKKQEVLALLEEHITENIVKVLFFLNCWPSYPEFNYLSLKDRAILLSSDCWNTTRICSFLNTLLVLLRRPGEDILKIYQRSSKCMPSPCRYVDHHLDHCIDNVTTHWRLSVCDHEPKAGCWLFGNNEKRLSFSSTSPGIKFMIYP